MYLLKENMQKLMCSWTDYTFLMCMTSQLSLDMCQSWWESLPDKYFSQHYNFYDQSWHGVGSQEATEL